MQLKIMLLLCQAANVSSKKLFPVLITKSETIELITDWKFKLSVIGEENFNVAKKFIASTAQIKMNSKRSPPTFRSAGKVITNEENIQLRDQCFLNSLKILPILKLLRAFEMAPLPPKLCSKASPIEEPKATMRSKILNLSKKNLQPKPIIFITISMLKIRVKVQFMYCMTCLKVSDCQFQTKAKVSVLIKIRARMNFSNLLEMLSL